MRLTKGDPAPAFSRPDQDENTTSSDDLAGRRYVVYFFPKAFTPGCTAESCDFRDRHETLSAAGYTILGVSPDPVARLEQFRAEHTLPFTLLSDEDHSMAEAFGAWGVKKNYGREYEGIIRSTIIVDETGTVDHAWYNVRAKGHVERIARELEE